MQEERDGELQISNTKREVPLCSICDVAIVLPNYYQNKKKPERVVHISCYENLEANWN